MQRCNYCTRMAMIHPLLMEILSYFSRLFSNHEIHDLFFKCGQTRFPADAQYFPHLLKTIWLHFILMTLFVHNV